MDGDDALASSTPHDEMGARLSDFNATLAPE